MNPKIKREEAGLTQSEALRFIRAADKRLNVPLLSKMEHKLVLPTVPVLRAMCRLYGCTPLDMYTEEELDLIGCLGAKMPPVTAARDGHKWKRKFTGRLSECDFKFLKGPALSECGYPSQQAWFSYCIKRLRGEYAALCKARKNGKAAAGTATNPKSKIANLAISIPQEGGVVNG